jgi:hypothetical protein
MQRQGALNKNPISGSYHSRILYADIWILITGIQTLIAYLTNDLPFGYVLMDAVVFNLLFACFIIQLWYPVRYNKWERRTWHFNVAAHFSLACAFIAGWFLIGYPLLWLIGADDSKYIDFLTASVWWRIIEGISCYVVTILTCYIYVYVEQLNEKAANEIRLNQLLKEGELNLLKSQINPHFLFNSLNSVNSLIISDQERAQQMLVALSDYLRYAVMSTNCVYSCVADEMENIMRYLSIEKLRFGDKLVYEADIAPECLSAKIPAMLLQPLFENAVKHGVYESLQTVHVMVKIFQDAQYLCIKLSNDYDNAPASPKKGAGAGLQNVCERLRLLYGNAAALHSKATDGKFAVMLKIPFQSIP